MSPLHERDPRPVIEPVSQCAECSRRVANRRADFSPLGQALYEMEMRSSRIIKTKRSKFRRRRNAYFNVES